MIKLPQEGAWLQANNSDLFGNIAQTKNITFDKKGYVRLSNSCRVALNSNTTATLDEAAVIIRSEDHGYYVVSHDENFEVDDARILGNLPTEDVAAGNPSGGSQSDATYSNGLLVVTQSTDVDYYDPVANTWTDTNISLTSTTAGQHPIEKFISLSALAIADVNTVKLYPGTLTATPTLTVTLTIPSSFYITSLAYFNQNLYIGTMNRDGGHAFLYVWNGYGTAAQSAYEVDSNIIYDVCMHQDSIVCFTGKGQLLRFNGAGFTQLDALPSFYSDIVISDETNVNMYHNCLKSNGDVLYINVSTRSNEYHLTNQPDGVWCYDSTLGFMYHRYGLSAATVSIQTVANTNWNTTTNEITVTSAPITGTEVLIHTVGTMPTEVQIDTRYYVIKIDSTHVKLATSRTNALAGIAVDFTTQPSVTTSIVFFPNTDFGSFYANSRSMAIMPIEREMKSPQYGADLIYGGTMTSTTNGNIDCIGTTTGYVENRGYFVTPKITSQAVTDTFNLVTCKFSKFLSDTDKIIIKYRTTDDRRDIAAFGVSGGIARWTHTWTSTNTFTSTEPELANAVVGDEVEFLRGGGAGILAHITNIVNVGGTYTVTIDETYDYYTAGDAGWFIFRNWKKWLTVAHGDVNAEQGYISAQLGETGKFLQLKVEMRGVRTQVEELTVDNVYHLPSRRS